MIECELTIERMSYGPAAIAHASSGKTVFVEGAVPGDVVRAQIIKEGARFDTARVLEVIEASPSRVLPPELVSAGALPDKKTAPLPTPSSPILDPWPWALMSAAEQQLQKRQGIVSNLTRIAHMEPERAEALVREVVVPSDSWGYRNKLELSVGMSARDLGRVGIFSKEQHQVVSLSSYPLFDQHFSKVPKQVAGALSYLARSRDLGIERVGIRASRRTKDLEIALWTEPSGFPRAHVAKVLGDACKASSIVRVMQKGPLKARRVVGVERLSGKGNWSERMGENTLYFSAPSFFQVNTRGAEALVRLVLEGLDVQEDEEAADLYCGAGTFTVALAQRCAYVSAVESYGPAVRDLRRNIERAGLDNVDAVGGDAGMEFPEVDAHVMVVDPPRAGLAADVVEKISACGKRQMRALAYVSCDPATLARDLKRFEELGVFKPVSITPVDLFPQTYHVETVTLLSCEG